MIPIEDKSFVFVCRFCERLAEARDAGRETCNQDCGGPKRGRDFPLYKGPLTPGYMVDHCFVCGEGTSLSVTTSGSNRHLGVCKRHFIHAGIRYEELKAKASPEDLGVVERKVVEIPPEELFGLGDDKK